MKAQLVSTLLAFAISTMSLARDQSAIEQSIVAISNGEYVGIDSLLIYQGGERVSEHYFNQFDAGQLHQTRSTFKSITGLLAAIAFDQELLSSDELVYPLLSRYGNQQQPDPRRARMKVSDLLHMTSGLDCSEMPGTGPYHDEVVDDGPEPLKYSLAIAMAADPGDQWAYCNANTFLLGATISAALERAERPSITAFAHSHLFAPLDIDEYAVYESPDGFLYAQGNARFRPRDLAKLGQLVLNRGHWKGQQLISEQHMDVILEGAVDTHWSWTDLIAGHTPAKSRYAYQWFRTLFDVSDQTVAVSHTWGNGGQFVFVIPSMDSVVVFTGSNYGDIRKQKQAFEILHCYLLDRTRPSSGNFAKSGLRALMLQGPELHSSLKTRGLDAAPVRHMPRELLLDNPYLSDGSDFIRAIAASGSQGRLGADGVGAALYALYQAENELGFYGLEAASLLDADRLELALRTIWSHNESIDRARVHRQDLTLLVVWTDGVDADIWQAVNSVVADRIKGSGR